MEDKPLTRQQIWYEKNKEVISEKRKQQYEMDKEKRKEYQKKYYEANKQKKLEYRKQYEENNKDKIKFQKQTYNKLNKETISEKKKEKYKANKETIKQKTKKYYDTNKDIINEKRKDYFIEYRKNNKDKRNEYIKNKRQSDPIFKLKHNVRNLVRLAINGKGYKKLTKTELILGCTFDEFKQHIENQFESWMNWDNYGLYNGEPNYGWDYDHIIPMKDGLTEMEVIKLNHYTNIRPLCSYTNRVLKKDKTQ